MTRYEKIAVSLPLRAAESARRAVRSGRATSVSAYVASAIDAYSQRDSLDELLDEILDRTGGPMTDAERRDVDRIMGIDKPKTARPKRGKPRTPRTKGGKAARRPRR